jgi:hypothetical protein
MKTVDSRSNWRHIDELLATETDDWRRHMLTQLKEHVQAECGSDLDALIATMSDNPRFHIWSATEDSGPKGLDALKEFYAGLIASGSNRFEYAVERIVIGDDTLVTEGQLHTPFSGAMLKQMGLPNIDETKMYATKGRTVTFWPFEKETGKIIGEDIYSITTDFADAEEIELNAYTYGEAL